MTIANPSSLVTQFLTDAELFGTVVAAGGDWSGASPCEGWTAADVLDHVISTERQFLGAHTDLGPEPTGGPESRWQTHLAALHRTLTADLVATAYDGYFGPTTIGETLRDFYGFDLLVHRWDLGVALGREVELTDGELARIEARIPEPGDPRYAMFYSEGICGPPVPVPPAASRQSATLAKLGRRP